MTLERRLTFTAPLDAEGLLGFLGTRAVPGVEAVVDGAYRRSARLPHGSGVLELRPLDDYVTACYRLEDPRDLDAAVERSRMVLDLDADPAAVAGALGDDRLLGPLVRDAPGRRVPGTVDGHELAVRAVLGQQVSLAGASTLAGRLVAAYGRPLARPLGTVTHLFPSAKALAAADPERLAMPHARRHAVLGLAAALARGDVDLSPEADPGEARRTLQGLPGIGAWTAEYVAMRALHDPDAFLAGDLGVRRALEQLGEDGRPAAAERLAERWRPYRAYAVGHLWASLTSRATAAGHGAPGGSPNGSSRR